MTPWIVVDTSMPLASIALVDGVQVLGEHVLGEQKRHAESLVDAFDRALLASGVSLGDVCGIAVGRGPGSFIGVRTGIAFAKGIALGRGVPLLGLPTLEALAADANLPDGDGLVVIDAKRAEAFVLRVRCLQGEVWALHDPQALSLVAATELARDAAFVVGNSALAVEVPQLRREGPSGRGLARVLARRLTQGPIVDELDTLIPDYRREADAKLPAVDPGANRPALTSVD